MTKPYIYDLRQKAIQMAFEASPTWGLSSDGSTLRLRERAMVGEPFGSTQGKLRRTTLRTRLPSPASTSWQ